MANALFRRLRCSSAVGALISPYAILGFEPPLVLDFDAAFYRVGGSSTDLVSAATHTRSSAATYVDASGILQTAGVNVPRVGHHIYNGSVWIDAGYFHESEARTNLATYSEDFTNPAWTKAETVISSNAIISPDGQVNASKIYESGATSVHQIYNIRTLGSGTAYCHSFFAKAADYSIFHTRSAYITSGDWIGLDVDLSAKTVSVAVGASNTSTTISFGMEDVGNGWFRVHHVWSTASSETAGDCLISLTDGTARSTTSGSATYTGDGTSGIYIYGAQLEAGSTPSSYIPTSVSTVTRAADAMTIPAVNMPWNPLAVSIQMEGTATWSDRNVSVDRLLFSWAIDGSNLIRSYIDTGGALTGRIVFQQNAGGVQDFAASGVDDYSAGINVPFNIASRHGSTFINGAVDGTALTANLTPTALPYLENTDMQIGSDFMGTIKLFRVWADDLTDAGIAEASA
jgi:hypothetical protein